MQNTGRTGDNEGKNYKLPWAEVPTQIGVGYPSLVRSLDKLCPTFWTAAELNSCLASIKWACKLSALLLLLLLDTWFMARPLYVIVIEMRLEMDVEM